MFSRPDHTYEIHEEIINNILQDERSPLNTISKIIPDDVKVLDIGAGNGLLARILTISHKSIIIDGIEPNSYAGNLAKNFYRQFHIGFVQDYYDTVKHENYDYIVFADVIEHIVDPLIILKQLSNDLSQRSKIVLSIPNISFGSVRLSLLQGNFDYTDSGLIEKSHVRFFTKKTIFAMVAELGLNIEKIYYIQRNIFRTEIKLDENNIDLITLFKLVNDELASTYQFIVVLTKQQVDPKTIFLGGKIGYSTILSWYFKQKLRSIISIMK